MQRVVIVFVGILTVVRATPFYLDSVDQPTPFWYKVGLSNEAFSEGSKHNGDYEIGAFESDQHSNFIDEPDEGKSMQGLVDLFRDIKQCDLMDLRNPPKKGCAYLANGNVFFYRVLTAMDIKDVNKAFDDAGIKGCKVGEDGHIEEPSVKGLLSSCFWFNEDIESVYLIGVYDENVFYKAGEIDDIKVAFDNIEKCDMTVEKTPLEGCALYDQEGIHLINILNELSVDDFERIVSKLDISECISDKTYGLINDDLCYWVNLPLNTIHLLNLSVRPEAVQDNDDDDDTKETPPSVVETETGNVNLQQMKFKGLFNQQSSVVKHSKAVFPKEIQSRKQPQEVQQKLGRRDHQHDRHGSNGDKVNHRPKWMKYLQTNA